MTDPVERLRAALDAEQQYAETSDNLLRQDSLTLLRMVAAHRKILDLHRNDGGDCSTCHGTPEREVLWDGSEETWSWTSVPVKFPCPTVTALAAALQVEP